MHWIRLGRAVRALRRRLGWRQRDLATAAGVSQQLVSRVELGRGDIVLPRSLESIAKALGARLVTYLDWNGDALDRLLDAEHAALVEAVVRILGAQGWEVLAERTFTFGPERGAIDVLAWHARSGSLLVVEVKSVIADAQETLARLDRKVRLAARIAPPEWRARSISSLLVVGDTRTNRRRIGTLAATFDAAFPDRVAAVRAFLADPASRTVRGLWFLTANTAASTRHRIRRH